MNNKQKGILLMAPALIYTMLSIMIIVIAKPIAILIVGIGIVMTMSLIKGYKIYNDACGEE